MDVAQTHLLFEKSKTKNFYMNRMYMRFKKGTGETLVGVWGQSPQGLDFTLSLKPHVYAVKKRVRVKPLWVFGGKVLKVLTLSRKKSMIALFFFSKRLGNFP
ncbi:MAG: hypothetical protein PHG19_06890 [Anaerotignum sp.]|nr:hypothetical protein [Anaerotignum sp.]